MLFPDQAERVWEGDLRRAERQPAVPAADVSVVDRLRVGLFQGDGRCEGGEGDPNKEHTRQKTGRPSTQLLGQTVSTDVLNCLKRGLSLVWDCQFWEARDVNINEIAYILSNISSLNKIKLE